MDKHCCSLIQKVIDLIEEKLQYLSKYKKRSSVMLTGGRTAAKLYETWRLHQDLFALNTHIDYYFGDERCVSLEHIESNYKLVNETLFSNVKSLGCNLYPMLTGLGDMVNEADRYAKLLPSKIDILLLSVGEDGHIASLFPGSTAITSKSEVVYINNAPKLPCQRLTITPKVIYEASQVFVMAAGPEKGRVLALALEEPDNILSLPVRLTIGSTWLLDQKAAETFEKYAPTNKHNTRIIYA